MGWGNKGGYRCPKCVHGLKGVFKKATKAKRHKINGKKYTEEEMEDYKKKLVDEHMRIIEEIHLNFMEERERIIRDRDAEIEKEGENDILGNSVFRIEKTCIDCDEEYEAVYH